ncbi:uncharacterized protein F5891DRAFT_1188831 [Suillus fuscotomentosus]|uniref:Uncharacterized protein n=1 Tax=Suillus fuscotomentosus TaxID=1912939 RepID=A0AAD4E5J8_9AGAM|nr:uncharacterized protein F5891DRAFT_1188831 [Suillus fuscotomentosus]KAG1900143.1 hypothetical protein F5891DRAFT_1188831 [Suillus fuscotomentosus]
MALTRRTKALNDLYISNSEENPMVPSQLKRTRKKVAASTPKDPVESDSPCPESECAHLYVAHPSDRFGFKPLQSQSQATQPTSHTHKEATSEVTEWDSEKHRRQGDIDDFDESGKSADEHEMQDERRAIVDDFREQDDDEDLMEFDQSQSGREDKDEGLLINVHPNVCLVSPLRHILLPLALSLLRVHIEKCHLQRLVLLMAYLMVLPPTDYLLLGAPLLGPQAFWLAQGPIQAEVVIPPAADCLLIALPVAQQPFPLAQDLLAWVYPMVQPPVVQPPVDCLLVDVPCRDHHIGKPLNLIASFLIPLLQAALALTNPSKLGFYPPCWQAFLQAAKLEMRLQAVLTHPIPEHKDVLQLAREVLDVVLWKYHSKKIKIENGYFPEYRAQMSFLLCDDLFTFRTELKKIILSIAKQLYGIFPKGSIAQKDAIQ